NFSPIVNYTLTMAVSGNGSTTPAVGDYTYEEGTVVPITATPDADWRFVSWTGDVADPSSASTTVTVDADKTVTANFSPIGYMTLTMVVDGNGTTTPAVGVYSYEEGTVVPITATPDAGWEFDSWSGDVADPSSASTTVTMDTDKTVTANFSQGGGTTPPAISGISESNVTSSSADIGWTTDEPADSQVAYRASPGWLTSLDETLVTVHLVQLTGLQPATTYYYKVMSRDGAGNLTVSDEMEFTTLGLPASFGTSDWSVSLAEVDAGKEATISFLVTNSGGLGGSYAITLTINGVVEATREVTLGAGASEMVTFTTIKGVAGTYQVSVDELSFSFTVVEGEISPPAGGINWWLVVGIIIGVLLLLLALLVLLVRADRIPARFIPGFIPVTLFGGKEDRDTREIARASREAGAQAMKETAKARREARKAGEPKEAIERVQREAERADKASGQPVSRLDVGVEKAGLMLTVTALAAKKMKEAIQTKTTDPKAGFRLVPSPSKPNQLKIVLDREKGGDQIVESEGVKILLLSPEVAPMLEGMVIDYHETPEGGGFTISKIASEQNT
ncbi:MAG: fibronectin type III domain-containing protein, partial [Dehalococcoidales bacterium]